MRNVIPTAWAIIKDNLSSKTTLFFVFFFPLFLTFVFAFGFGAAAQPHIVVDVVGSPGLSSFLSNSSLFTATTGVGEKEALLHDYVYLEVNNTGVSLIYPSQDAYAIPSLEALIQEYFSHTSVVNITPKPEPSFSYYGYVVSGMIGVVALSNGVFGVTGVAAGYYRDRLVDRLAASPLKSYEWVVSLMIYEILITLLSSVPVLALGLAFGFIPVIGLAFVAFLALATLMFSGLGAVIFGLSPKDKLFVAQTAANVIVFPLMFLSNAFFPLDSFPLTLRNIVAYQPLSIMNDVIRDVMVYNILPPVTDLGYVLVSTLVFILLGAKLMKLRETD